MDRISSWPNAELTECLPWCLAGYWTLMCGLRHPVNRILYLIYGSLQEEKGVFSARSNIRSSPYFIVFCAPTWSRRCAGCSPWGWTPGSPGHARILDIKYETIPNVYHLTHLSSLKYIIFAYNSWFCTDDNNKENNLGKYFKMKTRIYGKNT